MLNHDLERFDTSLSYIDTNTVSDTEESTDDTFTNDIFTDDTKYFGVKPPPFDVSERCVIIDAANLANYGLIRDECLPIVDDEIRRGKNLTQEDRDALYEIMRNEFGYSKNYDLKVSYLKI